MTTPISNRTTPTPGFVAEVPYPFVRDTYTEHDMDGEGVFVSNDLPTWRPGVRNEEDAPGYVTSYADAMGRMVLTVIDVHRPGKYPTRVFFTRHWITPEGKRFGKNKLRITTVEAFNRYQRGYQHEFEMVAEAVR
jgi:hypothetical protein